MTYYLYIGLGLAICFYLYCVVEDIFRNKLLHHKFGYNYKNPIIWWMSILLAIPIINILWIALWSVLSIRWWYHFTYKGNND